MKLKIISIYYLFCLIVLLYSCSIKISDEVMPTKSTIVNRIADATPCTDCCMGYADTWCTQCKQCNCCRNCACDPCAKRKVLNEEQVNKYLDFRDSYLKENDFGKKLIVIYYKNSARLVDIIDYDVETKNLYQQLSIDMLSYYLSLKMNTTMLVAPSVIVNIKNVIQKISDMNQIVPDVYKEKDQMHNDLIYIMEKINIDSLANKNVKDIWNEIKTIIP